MNHTSFVIVMPISGEHEHYDLRVVNLVDQSMLLADTAAPLPCAVASKGLGLSFGLLGSCLGLRGYPPFPVLSFIYETGKQGATVVFL